MSKFPCDNSSWSSRRGDPRLRDRDANKENIEPISPLSRLAEKVDDSRRWAPIPDRWHNHCEWLVDHHRNLRKRFRKTTANDRLAGVLTTLKCTQERWRGSDEDESVVGRGSRYKRSRWVNLYKIDASMLSKLDMSDSRIDSHVFFLHSGERSHLEFLDSTLRISDKLDWELRIRKHERWYANTNRRRREKLIYDDDFFF